tara:strand:+ start:13948 stop:14934 length:987 start_codon:yes stop_codon:yes gene_type:complete
MNSTLQINLAPSDYRISRYLLSHQIETWREQVDEILLTIDLRKSNGRFGMDWEAGKSKLLEVVSSFGDTVRVVNVDYSLDMMRRVAIRWTGGCPIPAKDFRGGPCYSYLYGMFAARGRWILHSDADMLFGGRSPTWLAEAIEFVSQNPEVLFAAPHSGAPASGISQRSLPNQPDDRAINGSIFDFMSTRLFLIDTDRFDQLVKRFVPVRPSWRGRLKAKIEGNPAWDLPEHWMTTAMIKHHMIRYEFSGTGNGMWSLHPPYRCEDFYRKLPDIIACVENGTLPQLQVGQHDLTDSMVDWSEAKIALRRNRWWKRLLCSKRAVQITRSA